jgi:catecholate siderophore receptor
MVEHNLTESTSVKLNVSNLTNKRYIDQVYSGFYVPGTPRRIELGLKSMF